MTTKTNIQPNISGKQLPTQVSSHIEESLERLALFGPIAKELTPKIADLTNLILEGLTEGCERAQENANKLRKILAKSDYAMFSAYQEAGFNRKESLLLVINSKATLQNLVTELINSNRSI